MGGVILLLWSGTCSLQLAGNSGQGANLRGFCLKTLQCHITEFNIQLMGKFPPQKLSIHNGATFLLCVQGLDFLSACNAALLVMLSTIHSLRIFWFCVKMSTDSIASQTYNWENLLHPHCLSSLVFRLNAV